MTIDPSTTGDMAVPNSGGAAGASVRHNSFPVARSRAERMPLMPNVKTRPPATAGVDFGPGPCPRAAGFIVYGAAYSSRHSSLPVFKIDCARDLALALAGVHDHAVAGDDRRRVPRADRQLPAFGQCRRPGRGRSECRRAVALLVHATATSREEAAPAPRSATRAREEPGLSYVCFHGNERSDRRPSLRS